MNWLSKIAAKLKKITVKDVIYFVAIFALTACLSYSVSRCSDARSEYKNNIEALTDSVRYYQDKNGNLVATKRAFETELKDLKILNEDLYNQLKDLKAKGNITSGVHFSGVVENPSQDTTYIVSYDTITRGFSKDFAFNNEYRILEGNVSYKNDTVGVKIEKDQIMFDYTVALDDKNNIMIRSANPYVRYNEMTGFQIPKPKDKHWSLGLFGNYGYNPSSSDQYVDVGISLDYSLKRFSVGPIIYYEHNFLTKDKSMYIGGSLNINLLEW